MLVLSRRWKEAIVLNVHGERIVVRVMRTGREKIRLGFEATPACSIVREEIEQIEQNGPAYERTPLGEAALAYLQQSPHEAM